MTLGERNLAAQGTSVHTVVRADSLSEGNLEASRQPPAAGPGMAETV